MAPDSKSITTGFGAAELAKFAPLALSAKTVDARMNAKEQPGCSSGLDRGLEQPVCFSLVADHQGLVESAPGQKFFAHGCSLKERRGLKQPSPCAEDECLAVATLLVGSRPLDGSFSPGAGRCEGERDVLLSLLDALVDGVHELVRDGLEHLVLLDELRESALGVRDAGQECEHAPDGPLQHSRRVLHDLAQRLHASHGDLDVGQLRALDLIGLGEGLELALGLHRSGLDHGQTARVLAGLTLAILGALESVERAGGAVGVLAAGAVLVRGHLRAPVPGVHTNDVALLVESDRKSTRLNSS